MKTEWQEYDKASQPENTMHIEAILSKNKPSKDSIGIIVNNKLWVRFWVLEE